MSKLDRIRGMETCYKIDSQRIQDVINTCAMSRERLSLLCEAKGHIDETVYLLQKLFKESEE